jgi:hypothetical protein
MNLDGVAAAQADGRAALAGEVDEITFSAAGAIGIARRRRGLADLSGPRVYGRQPVPD